MWNVHVASTIALSNQPSSSEPETIIEEVEGNDVVERNELALHKNDKRLSNTDVPHKHPMSESETVEDATERGSPSRGRNDKTIPSTIEDEFDADVDADNSALRDSDDDSGASTVAQEKESLDAPLKVNGQTLLTTVKEGKVDDLHSVDVTEYRRLLVENKSLRDKLHSFRSDYEDRVTPFRDIFEEVRCKVKRS